MKLTLGTGNFNSKFNLVKNNILSNKIKKKIIDTAIKSKISYFDTAPVYGNAEKIIGLCNSKNKRIITKIPKMNFKNKKKIFNWIISSTQDSLKNLNRKKIYGILAHDLNDFLNNKNEFIKAFIYLKNKNLVSKVGVSLYSSIELFSIIKFWKPDIIQIPYNIFDRRIETKKFINLIKKNKIELHVRSIFFKGLLVNERLNFGRTLNWQHHLDEWFKWCKSKKIEPQTACYLFVEKNNLVKNIVISFDNIMQMKKIVNIKKRKLKEFPKFIIKNKKYLNPSNWS